MENDPRNEPTPTETEPSPAESESLDVARVESGVIQALKTVFDPEIPVNIYELGLIYDVKIEPDGTVKVTMTLTAPACPAAEIIPVDVVAMPRR